MITPTPALIDWLKSLPSYSNSTLGRPVCQTQCAGCGKLAIPQLTTWVIGPDGLCPTCKKIRAPHRDVIRLFKPMARKDKLSRVDR